MIPSVIVVTIMLRPLEDFLISITDKYLFQKKYNYLELFRAFTSDVLTVLDLDELIRLTKDKLKSIIKLDYCEVLLMPDNANVIESNAVLSLPITMRNRTIGKLLLGKKKSDEDYTQDDLDILRPLARSLSIAITNAMLVDEIFKAQQGMAQKDRMATMGTLAAGMAHEIRNPITTIRVFSEYMPDRLNEADFRERYRKVVTKEIDKIDHIIQTLIDFSGEDIAGERASTSVYEAVEELISIVAGGEDVSERMQFVNCISPDLPKVKADKEEFDEIILNLTQNAIDAIAASGTIKFSAEEEGEDIVLEISDTGCGMSEETVKHVFNPFFTTRSKGHGLGLFVVKELVNRNHGEIKVESLIGSGSTFTLRFKESI